MATTGGDPLLTMVGECARADDVEEALAAALRFLPAVSGALDVRHSSRAEAAVEGAALTPGAGFRESHTLPGHAGVLVLTWREQPTRPDPALETALAVLDATLARRQVEEDYDDLVARVDNAQRLANMGDYDWHIASDTNRWSDQLYRIYGHEPQSFNASYERFLEMVHPEDRELIMSVHQEAYRTGEPYQMLERIVRPDGEVRYLASNGQVLRDETGTPLRFRGTCLDITDAVRAEQAREAIAARELEHRLRRHQALEINDSVVQGLVAASYALELGDHEQAATHLAGTLAAARDMMDDLLDLVEGSQPAPGDLVRSAPASFGPDDMPQASAAGEPR